MVPKQQAMSKKRILIHYINERGGFAIVPELKQPTLTFVSLKQAFEELLKHELAVSASINDLVDRALSEKRLCYP